MARLRHRDRGTIVTVSDDTAAKMVGYDPAEEDAHVCDVCGFEAKTAGGLGAHHRTHDDED